MIKAYVGVTDSSWFELLREQVSLPEVNFWQPSGKRRFRALNSGELFLFKLHSPDNYIVGGGIFTHSSMLPISLAWEAFGVGNGASSLSEMKKRVEKYRRIEQSQYEDYTLGCIILEEPFFFTREDWIPVPYDWSSNIVQGKGYDLGKEPGLSLWKAIEARIGFVSSQTIDSGLPQYGKPVLVRPRLGQGAFRILVTDGYERRCAFTGERTLPALDAAHIKPYSMVNEHSVSNGLLLRKDIHALFDRGYITVDPDYKIEVSRKIKEEFENGKDYYRFHGSVMRMPIESAMKPDLKVLSWHNENIFRG